MILHTLHRIFILIEVAVLYHTVQTWSKLFKKPIVNSIGYHESLKLIQTLSGNSGYRNLSNIALILLHWFELSFHLSSFFFFSNFKTDKFVMNETAWWDNCNFHKYFPRYVNRTATYHLARNIICKRNWGKPALYVVTVLFLILFVGHLQKSFNLTIWPHHCSLLLWKQYPKIVIVLWLRCFSLVSWTGTDLRLHIS